VLQKKQIRPNPNQPLIDPVTRAVRGAVVFLRGVDVRLAKPWDLPPVGIVQRDCRFEIIQGNLNANVGFVRRGDAVEMVSRDPHLHVLRATGSAFFSLTFPDPDLPRHRSLDEIGLVELMSGAGYFWMRAYLFVGESPYYTRTDDHGAFELTAIPPGSYELVCWLPNWNEARHERDPESGSISRLFYRPPGEVRRSVQVNKGGCRQVEFTLSAADF
jgi:hypothetical protein